MAPAKKVPSGKYFASVTYPPKQKLGEWVAEDGTETTLFVADLLEETRELQREACANFDAYDRLSRDESEYLVDLQTHRAKCPVCTEFDRIVDWLHMMRQRDDAKVREWRMKRTKML